MNDKKYLIKMYRAGVYQGVLPYVVEDISYQQEINTAGCEISVKLGTDLKGAGIGVSVDYLVTAAANHITDDNGNRIITRKDYMFNTVPVDIGNQADVWLYYSGALNGVRVFSGLVSSWEADNGDGTINMTALSWGVQLDNYPIKVSPNSTILDYQIYTTTDSLFADLTSGPYNRTTGVAQTFQVLSSTGISAIYMQLSRPPELTFDVYASLSLYQGTPGGAITLLSVTSRMISNTTMGMQKFSFATPIQLASGTTYSMVLHISAGVDTAINVGRNAGGGYASGQAYTYNDSTSVWTTTTGDYAFQVVTGTGAVGNQFNSYDPGDIVVSLLDNFTNAGGIVDCNETSVGATGTVVSYTFKYNTVLDGIKKCLELAPPNWYWYVDVGSNILYFQQYKLAADHIMIKGKHISDLKIKYSLEDVINYAVFTGGEVSGTNIVSTKTNTASISKYGQWMETDSDSRVTVQTTADTLANNILGEHAQPNFATSCVVLAGQYDIEKFKIGQMVGFENCDDLTNSLILQIVGLARSADKATLQLATLPPAQTHRIEDIKRNLDAVITQNNPAQ